MRPPARDLTAFLDAQHAFVAASKNPADQDALRACEATLAETVRWMYRTHAGEEKRILVTAIGTDPFAFQEFTELLHAALRHSQIMVQRFNEPEDPPFPLAELLYIAEPNFELLRSAAHNAHNLVVVQNILEYGINPWGIVCCFIGEGTIVLSQSRRENPDLPPILIALVRGFEDMFEYMFHACPGDPSQMLEALHVAVMFRRPRAVELLLDAGTHPIDHRGVSLLGFVCAQRAMLQDQVDIFIAMILIASGACLNGRVPTDPLSYAASRITGSNKLLALLIGSGAYITPDHVFILRRLFLSTAHIPDIDTVALLLGAGIDPTTRIEGHTTISLAAGLGYRDHQTILEGAVSYYADADTLQALREAGPPYWYHARRRVALAALSAISPHYPLSYQAEDALAALSKTDPRYFLRDQAEGIQQPLSPGSSIVISVVRNVIMAAHATSVVVSVVRAWYIPNRRNVMFALQGVTHLSVMIAAPQLYGPLVVASLGYTVYASGIETAIFTSATLFLTYYIVNYIQVSLLVGAWSFGMPLMLSGWAALYIASIWLDSKELAGDMQGCKFWHESHIARADFCAYAHNVSGFQIFDYCHTHFKAMAGNFTCKVEPHVTDSTAQPQCGPFPVFEPCNTTIAGSIDNSSQTLV